MRCVPRLSLALVTAMASFTLAHAQTVEHTFQFEQSHPLSAVAVQAERFGVPVDQIEAMLEEEDGYDVAREKYVAVFPKEFDSERPLGVFVWVSPLNHGRLPAGWGDVLAKRGLIGIGADRSGNSRKVPARVALALDAVHNLADRFPLDRDRIYVGGFSGGGRLTSRLGFHYADVFSGAIYMGGCNYWETIRNPAQAGTGWPAALKKPAGALYRATKTKLRHAFLIGDQDYNHAQSQGIYKKLKLRDRFRHVTFVEVPELEHQFAGAEWFERALDAIDPPGDEERGERKKKSEDRDRRRRP